MTAADILRAAKKRISDPDRWTTGDYARTPDNRGVSPTHTEACAWCAAGAVYAALGMREDSMIFTPEELDLLANAAGERRHPDEPIEDIASFNDAPTTTHADVLALFDRAIALAEKS